MRHELVLFVKDKFNFKILILILILFGTAINPAQANPKNLNEEIKYYSEKTGIPKEKIVVWRNPWRDLKRIGLTQTIIIWYSGDLPYLEKYRIKN